MCHVWLHGIYTFYVHSDKVISWAVSCIYLSMTGLIHKFFSLVHTVQPSYRTVYICLNNYIFTSQKRRRKKLYTNHSTPITWNIYIKTFDESSNMCQRQTTREPPLEHRLIHSRPGSIWSINMWGRKSARIWTEWGRKKGMIVCVCVCGSAAVLVSGCGEEVRNGKCMCVRVDGGDDGLDTRKWNDSRQDNLLGRSYCNIE